MFRPNRWLVERSFHRRVIQREISRVLVLNLSGEHSGAYSTAQDNFALDKAFALIEGHPAGDRSI